MRSGGNCTNTDNNNLSKNKWWKTWDGHKPRNVTKPCKHSRRGSFSGPLMYIPFTYSLLRVMQSLVFCIVFCRSLFVLVFFFIWPLCCMSFFTAFDYTFGIIHFVILAATILSLFIELLVFNVYCNALLHFKITSLYHRLIVNTTMGSQQGKNMIVLLQCRRTAHQARRPLITDAMQNSNVSFRIFLYALNVVVQS